MEKKRTDEEYFPDIFGDFKDKYGDLQDISGGFPDIYGEIRVFFCLLSPLFSCFHIQRA